MTVQLSGAGPVRSTQRARAAARFSCVSVSGAAAAVTANASQARRRIGQVQQSEMSFVKFKLEASAASFIGRRFSVIDCFYQLG